MNDTETAENILYANHTHTKPTWYTTVDSRPSAIIIQTREVLAYLALS